MLVSRASPKYLTNEVTGDPLTVCAGTIVDS
jgi:hypothetical protein